MLIFMQIKYLTYSALLKEKAMEIETLFALI